MVTEIRHRIILSTYMALFSEIILPLGRKLSVVKTRMDLWIYVFLYELLGRFSEDLTDHAFLECLNDGFGNDSFILHSYLAIFCQVCIEVFFLFHIKPIDHQD